MSASVVIERFYAAFARRDHRVRVECGPITTSAETATAEWQAWYTYSATGRPVHNRIAATFVFEDGLIRKHEDVFDLYRWSRQALGAKGILLGWTPMVHAAIRKQAGHALDSYAQRNP